MNNDEAPLQAGNYRYPDDDEISLVELTKILIKRWKVVLGTFLFIVLGGLGYALSLEKTYEYISIYQVAENGPASALEKPVGLVAKANNIYVGPVTRKFLVDEGLGSLPFNINISNPKSTLLIRFSSQAAVDSSELVRGMHESLLQRLHEDQMLTVTRQKNSLQRQLESAKSSLEVAKEASGSTAAELRSNYSSQVSDLEGRLAQLHEGTIKQIAVQSLSPVGTSRKLIMALTLVLAGVLAVMMVFLAQFAAAVRQSLKEE